MAQNTPSHVDHRIESVAAIDAFEGASEPAGVEDTVAVYLREIGRIPLLTPEEEHELAERIVRGRRASERLEAELPLPERAAAEWEAEEGARAARLMVESNLRLVVSVASRYGGRGLPLADLIEEGNLGLMRATQKFDPSRGFRFSTYAVWWIRQAVTRGIDNQARTVRLPGHIIERMGRIAKAVQRLTQELGREPTSDELSRETGLRPEQVRDVLRASQRTVSLEQPYGEGGELSLAEHVEDEGWAIAADEMTDEALRLGVLAAVRELSEREQRVLALRHGLGGERRHTLEEAGRQLGVTRERIRQIEKEALAKLRQTGRCDALRPKLREVA